MLLGIWGGLLIIWGLHLDDDAVTTLTQVDQWKIGVGIVAIVIAALLHIFGPKEE
jgi:hypothetical protein